MKQTAVEWLESIIKHCERFGTNVEQKDIEQAKEMEKEQQGYSEEELKSAFKIGFSIGYGSPVNGLDSKEETCDVWFEQFKNK